MVTGGVAAVVLSVLLGAGAVGHGAQLVARSAGWPRRSAAVLEVVMALTMLGTVWGWAGTPSAAVQFLVFGPAAAWFGYRWLHRVAHARLLGTRPAAEDPHCGHHAVGMLAMATMAGHALVLGHQAHRHGAGPAGWAVLQALVLAVLVLAALRCVVLLARERDAQPGGRRDRALVLATTAGMACAFLPT